MSQSQPPRSVTREELYRQVWETPMSRLASQYGISGNGLAKICQRLNIPYPSRGFWARKAAGKRTVQYQLPEPDGNTPDKVVISPTPPPPPAFEPPPEVQAQKEAITKQAARFVVPKTMGRPHPAVAAWIAEHKQFGERARLSPYSWHRQSHYTALDRRQHRILSTLFKALEHYGFSVNAKHRHDISLEIHGERLEVKLREKRKQVRIPLTDEEKRRGYYNEKGRVELQGTGRLELSITTRLVHELPKHWIDNPDKPLEQQFPEIITTLALAAPVIAERHRQWEAEQERLREEAHQRYLAEERRRPDQNRGRCLIELAEHWKNIETARRFLGELEKTATHSDIKYGAFTADEWITWAREWLAQADLLHDGSKTVFRELAQVHS